jgi:hypothetical protein
MHYFVHSLQTKTESLHFCLREIFSTTRNVNAPGKDSSAIHYRDNTDSAVSISDIVLLHTTKSLGALKQ